MYSIYRLWAVFLERWGTFGHLQDRKGSSLNPQDFPRRQYSRLFHDGREGVSVQLWLTPEETVTACNGWRVKYLLGLPATTTW